MDTPLALALLLATMNVLVSVAFAFDKLQAKRGGRRVNRHILAIALCLAPFLPTACMVWLHHKVRKRLFMIASIAAGTLQCAGFLWLLFNLSSAWSSSKSIAWLTVLAFAFLWAIALSIQLRRGCACETSSHHPARTARV